RRDVDLALAGMTRCLPRLVIAGDLLGEGVPAGMPDRGEDRRAAPADRRKRVRGAGGDADWRRRLLEWLRHHRDVVEAVVGAFVGKARLGPRASDDIEDLAEAVAAFGVGHAVGFVGLRHSAAADPEDQPPVTQLIDRRRLLGQPQRMAQWQYL